MFKTTNGGNTWTKLTIPQAGLLNSVYFTSSTTGYVVGDIGIILKTTDGGNTWTSQTYGTGNTFYSVHFVNSNTGYAVGYGGPTSPEVILKTSDSGGTWNLKSLVYPGVLRSVIFTDANTGFAVGDRGSILKTEDGGSTWNEIKTTTAKLKSIFFTSVDTGYVVGTGPILKTTDGGSNWISETVITGNTLDAVFFSDANTGYAVGGYGTILKYSGSDLLLTVSTYSLFITAANSTKTFDITSNTGWTVSSNQDWLSVNSNSGLGNSVITLTATANQTTFSRTATVTIKGAGVSDQTITVVQDGITTGISGIAKMDNTIYPNPVGNILYFNPCAGNVIIAIFDVNGKLIINKHVNDNQIDIRNLANGVYTLKIENSKGIITKEFIKQ
jgi:photosystem II stability/assembly factor-like uncharacterized protein